MDRLLIRSVAGLTACCVALMPGLAMAWGPQGHRVIARVAESRLTPAAREAVKELLVGGDTLADIANWADHEGHDAYPGSAPWHYVNVPITASRYLDGKDSKRRDCVVEKIKEYRKILADKSRPKHDRQRALLLLVHFVSDVHQPLHVGDNDDRGGNLTQVQFFGEGTNLHALWDSGLIHKVGGNDAAWVHRIDRVITPEAAKTWSKGTIEDWADESLQAAKLAYRDPEGPSPLKPIVTGATLGKGYLTKAEPILIDQMARASVRLADELNAAFR